MKLKSLVLALASFFAIVGGSAPALAIGDTPHTLYYSAYDAESVPSSVVYYGEDTMTVYVSDITPAKDDLVFVGWSLEDGGAASFYPGDPIELSSMTTILYAVWSARTESIASVDANVVPTDAGESAISPLGAYTSTKKSMSGAAVAITSAGIVFIAAIATSFAVYIYRLKLD